MPTWIADLCSNWGGAPHYDALHVMVQHAANVGFDAVKVQMIDVEAMYQPSDRRREVLRRYEIPLDELSRLRETCGHFSVNLGATVLNAGKIVDIGARCHWLKIASSESAWGALVRQVSSSGFDWAISTPPLWVRPRCWDDLTNKPFARFHCIPAYPTPVTQACLYRIEKDGGINGYSDHTRNIDVVLEAVRRYHVDYVELHFNSHVNRGPYPLPEESHSWTPSMFKELLTRRADYVAMRGDSTVGRLATQDFWSRQARDEVTGYRR